MASLLRRLSLGRAWDARHPDYRRWILSLSLRSARNYPDHPDYDPNVQVGGRPLLGIPISRKIWL